MRFSSVTVLALAGFVAAQTTPNEMEDVFSTDTELVVKFGDKMVEEPGMAMTSKDTAALPSIGLMEPVEGSYTLVVFDITVPANFPPGNPEPRRTLLHGMISGYTAAAEADEDGIYWLSTADATKPASYMGPSPPAETPPKAHNYVELLFKEPEDWAGPSMSFTGFANRMGFDRVEFVDGLGFDGGVVAANYFNVTGA